MRYSQLLSRAAAFMGLLASTLALGASTAGAATIHACVNKRSGAARIVGAKTKCRKSERRAYWNTAGPAGPSGAPGAPGAPGTAGANGVGADYGNENFGLNPLPVTETGDVVLSETLPAGSYFVNAKTVIGGTEASSAVFVAVICELVDTPGTPVFVEFSKALDLSEWAQRLAEGDIKGHYEAATTIAMQTRLITTQPTTLALMCAPLDGGKEATVEAFASQISALQTTANR